MTSDLATMTADELLRRYRRGEASPVEAVEAALARIDRHDAALKAFALVDREDALAAARASEARWRKGRPQGLLDGVPVTVKDLQLTRGLPTRRGSRTIDPKGPWRDDAPAVANLRRHGAVLLGKTTTPEFGWKGVTDSALMGVTRNPWDPAKTPGGSSGGAAVAAALGMGTLHQGTDGGGSIRIPAGFTGVFGLKPTFGRVPAWPASPFGTVSHLGPLTRSVADAALMLTVMAEPDPRDWYALPAAAQDWRVGLEGGVAGLRIAWSPRLGHVTVDPEIARLVARAVADLADQGAIVEQADPDLGDVAEIFRLHWFTGAANMARKMTPATRASVDPGLQEIMAEGERFTLAAYMEAVAAREALGLRMNQFHQRYDLLATPTLPIPAFEAGVEVPAKSGFKRWTEWTPFSYPFNLTRQPAATIPCGLTRSGLPAGLQIVGPLHREDLVLRACRAYESVRPIALPPAGKSRKKGR